MQRPDLQRVDLFPWGKVTLIDWLVHCELQTHSTRSQLQSTYLRKTPRVREMTWIEIYGYLVGPKQSYFQVGILFDHIPVITSSFKSDSLEII